MGSAIEGVGQKLMPVTAVVGGLSEATVKVASDFDSAMRQVAAVSGATGKELDALRDKAREMGSKTKFSASEAAVAMNYMAMVGLDKGTVIPALSVVAAIGWIPIAAVIVVVVLLYCLGL